ncbi:molybdopterin converting factor subunit 1 [Orbaceae bacterium ESL0721]|nr:molybdopterin converting factor subunit 1 [Orbaceae bacterium ESL0721]
MNKIVFFAQIRELIGTHEINIDAENQTIATMITNLSERGDNWSLALKSHSPLCAVNHTLVDHNYIIKKGDEIALFPPVTGG